MCLIIPNDNTKLLRPVGGATMTQTRLLYRHNIVEWRVPTLENSLTKRSRLQ